MQEADRDQGLIPMPRHLLEDTYRNDPASLAYSSRFTTDFVGLGPYRLVSWDPSSVIEFARFDDYYLGRAIGAESIRTPMPTPSKSPSSPVGSPRATRNAGMNGDATPNAAYIAT